jgi:hypothetical protein
VLVASELGHPLEGGGERFDAEPADLLERDAYLSVDVWIIGLPGYFQQGARGERAVERKAGQGRYAGLIVAVEQVLDGLPDLYRGVLQDGQIANPLGDSVGGNGIETADLRGLHRFGRALCGRSGRRYRFATLFGIAHLRIPQDEEYPMRPSKNGKQRADYTELVCQSKGTVPDKFKLFFGRRAPGSAG